MEQREDALIGRRIRALKADMDCDEHDRERPVPVGSSGMIWRLNHVDATGERHYDVAWDNGAWTIYSETEVGNDLQLTEG
jgi:hypothetical protein